MDIRKELEKRILVIDGAMGTMIQRYQLTEADFRGERFRDHPSDLQGNNDLLNITRPDVIKAIHAEYLDAGADIIETNTFSTQVISLADYHLEELAYELSYEGARLAREVADEYTKNNPEKPRFVAGAVGPTNRTASLSPDVNDPGYRAVTFDDLASAYYDQVRGLVDGGADVLLIETIFDTLNAKAALFACNRYANESGKHLPLMISGTITDASGRTLSGQTVEAFWNSVRHAKPFAIGLNCALGADLMRPHIAELSRVAATLVSAYPNAGLPNAMGEYDETPDETGHMLHDWAEQGIVNILGGCCGTTPDHIRHVADAVRGLTPRAIPERPTAMRLAGLEPFELV